jgi:hypothetical protein
VIERIEALDWAVVKAIVERLRDCGLTPDEQTAILTLLEVRRGELRRLLG